MRAGQGSLGIVLRFKIDQPIQNGDGNGGFAEVSCHRLLHAQRLDRVKAANSFEDCLLSSRTVLNPPTVTHQFQQIAGNLLRVFPGVELMVFDRCCYIVQ